MNTTRRSAQPRQRDERGSITLLEVLVGWVSFAFLLLTVWLTFADQVAWARVSLTLAVVALAMIPVAGWVAKESRDAAAAAEDAQEPA